MNKLIDEIELFVIVSYMCVALKADRPNRHQRDLLGIILPKLKKGTDLILSYGDEGSFLLTEEGKAAFEGISDNNVHLGLVQIARGVMEGKTFFSFHNLDPYFGDYTQYRKAIHLIVGVFASFREEVDVVLRPDGVKVFHKGQTPITPR